VNYTQKWKINVDLAGQGNAFHFEDFVPTPRGKLVNIQEATGIMGPCNSWHVSSEQARGPVLLYNIAFHLNFVIGKITSHLDRTTTFFLKSRR